MAAIDFKEVHEAHLGGGHQDTFELFARDFLTHLGYEVVEDPSRGADGGKDLLVVERRRGVGGVTVIRWLVSCKHKAHSGASVTHLDESNIRDRLEAHKCAGFLGFYSTLPSSGLADVVQGLRDKTETQIFDREKIESYLLKSPGGLHLVKRYFPKSFSRWIGDNPKPAGVFSTLPTLACHHCGQDLLSPKPSGIIVLWEKRNQESGKTHIQSVYWCCKGRCDQALAQQQRGEGCTDGWEDVEDVAIPLVFAKWVMVVLNKLYGGDTYSATAFERLKDFMLSVYPFVVREATSEETQRIERLAAIPAMFGGLGQ